MFKKTLLLLLMMITITANAQTTVYFGNLSDDVGVGVGIPQGFSPNITLSIMQLDRSKTFDDFSLKFINADGKEVNYNLQVDTVYHLNVEGIYYHQLDYTIDRMNYTKMCRELNSRTSVLVNDKEFNGAAFIGVVRSLETEQNSLFAGGPQNLRNVTMWNWQQINIAPQGPPTMTNIQLMRFRMPKGPRDFRFMRKVETDRPAPNTPPVMPTGR